MLVFKILGVYAIAYLIGSIPFSQMITSILKPGTDLRKVGCSNSGATNVFMTVGPIAGVLALILDMGKGLFAIFLLKTIMQWSFSYDLWWILSLTVFIILGHDYSVFLKFRGGKGLALMESFLLFFGPVWALLVHLPQAQFLFHKDLQRGLATANVLVLLMFPVMGLLWYIEGFIDINWLGWDFTKLSAEPVRDNLPLTVFSFIWMFMFFAQRVLDNPGVIEDIKTGISPWRAIMLRGVFEVFPLESKYRHAGPDVQMGEDVLKRKKVDHGM